MLLIGALGVCAVPQASAGGSSAGVADRVFTLVPNWAVGGSAVSAVSSDFTVYGVSGGVIWRLRPSETEATLLRGWLRGRSGGDKYTEATSWEPNSMSVAADGSVVWSTGQGFVWRRTPGPRARTILVAGSGNTRRNGVPVPGTPRQAKAVPVCPEHVAALPGGRVLIDDNGLAIRRVDRDGAIRTLYTTTPAARRVYCPSASDADARVTDLDAGQDGTGYALVLGREHSTILSLSGATVRRILAPQAATALTATPRGILFADGPRIRRWRYGRTGTTTITKANLSPGVFHPLFDGDGRRISDFGRFIPDGGSSPDAAVSTITGTPDGGALLSVNGLVYLAPQRPARLAVALEPRTGRAEIDGYTATVRVTRPGRARLSVLNSQGRAVASITRAVQAGVQRIAIRHRLQLAPYTVRVQVTGTDGQRAADRVGLFLGGVIDRRSYRLVIPGEMDISGCGLSFHPGPLPTAFASDCSSAYVRTRLGRCRQFGPRRVDCGFSYPASKPEFCGVSGLRLSPLGVTYKDTIDIDCPRTGRPGPGSRPLSLGDASADVPRVVQPKR